MLLIYLVKLIGSSDLDVLNLSNLTNLSLLVLSWIIPCLMLSP